jgi:hypothetical protein
MLQTAFGKESQTFGLFMGTFFGMFHMLERFIYYVRHHNRTEKDLEKECGLRAFIAGSLSGVSLLILDPDGTRTAMSQYLFVRALQCVYNAFKLRGMFHFWGSHWNHGDTLLFSLCVAPIMYCFSVRKNTLQPDYYKFIYRLSTVHRPILDTDLVCNIIRGNPIDEKVIHQVYKDCTWLDKYPVHPGVNDIRLIDSCKIIHPAHPSCWKFQLLSALITFRRVFGMYFTLHAIPVILFKYKEVLKAPLSTINHFAKNTVFSSMFLVLFVAIYQKLNCSIGNVMKLNVLDVKPKRLYVLFGFLTGLSVLMEKKSRRSELALYVFPKALEVLYKIGLEYKVYNSIPHGEVYLFSMAMGIIMSFYKSEAQSMSPTLYKIFKIFVDVK